MAFARINYFSRSLVKASSVSVVFPDDPSIPKPWWTFYLLHGLSDDDTIWMRRTSIERYAEGLPLVVVMPDGGRGWYTNAQVGFAYENDLMKDVMGLIERTFPVRAERSGRAIGGLSMGGYGAVKLGLKHHETFGSVNSHSGALGMLQQDWLNSERLKDSVRVSGAGSSARTTRAAPRTRSPSSSGSTTAGSRPCGSTAGRATSCSIRTGPSTATSSR
ncbi:MAG: alpha/beta hydrolase-fold protein [Isosphaeraceae bacterium]